MTWATKPQEEKLVQVTVYILRGFRLSKADGTIVKTKPDLTIKCTISGTGLNDRACL